MQQRRQRYTNRGEKERKYYEKNSVPPKDKSLRAFERFGGRFLDEIRVRGRRVRDVERRLKSFKHRLSDDSDKVLELFDSTKKN